MRQGTALRGANGRFSGANGNARTSLTSLRRARTGGQREEHRSLDRSHHDRNACTANGCSNTCGLPRCRHGCSARHAHPARRPVATRIPQGSARSACRNRMAPHCARLSLHRTQRRRASLRFRATPHLRDPAGSSLREQLSLRRRLGPRGGDRESRRARHRHAEGGDRRVEEGGQRSILGGNRARHDLREVSPSRIEAHG